jgi:hypothetical protein
MSIPRNGYGGNARIEGFQAIADTDATSGLLDAPVGASQYTVRDFLDEDLPPFRRVRELEAMAAAFTGQRLDTTISSLRDVLGYPISLEDYRRLHVLISHLYHSCGADIPQTTKLRTEVNQALTQRGNTHSRDRDEVTPCPAPTPTAAAAAAPPTPNPPPHSPTEPPPQSRPGTVNSPGRPTTNTKPTPHHPAGDQR